jgi:hypothetical protein
MKTNKIIGFAITLLALYLGYVGITKVSNNTSEVKVLGLEISASNESEKEKGYLYIGAAIIVLAGGLYQLKRQ